MTEARCRTSNEKIYKSWFTNTCSGTKLISQFSLRIVVNHQTSLSLGAYLTVNFDLLVPILVYFADEIVHLSHQLEVAEGQFV